MASQKTKTNPNKSALEQSLREIEITRAELEALSNPNNAQWEFVLSKNNEVLKMLSTNKVYKLDHKFAIDALICELPCDLGEIVENIQWLQEDLTELFLPQINKKQFIEYHRMLQSIKFYFMELLVEEGKRSGYVQQVRARRNPSDELE